MALKVDYVAREVGSNLRRNVTLTLAEKRVSSKRNDRGYLGFKLKAESDGDPVLTMDWVVIILTRQALHDASRAGQAEVGSAQ